MPMFSHLKFWAAALLAGFALALGGCFMAPGKFTAELALTGPDSFTFRYDGEIAFLALSRLAQAGAAADAAFKAEPCYNDETLAERPCTAASSPGSAPHGTRVRPSGPRRRRRRPRRSPR